MEEDIYLEPLIKKAVHDDELIPLYLEWCKQHKSKKEAKTLKSKSLI